MKNVNDNIKIMLNLLDKSTQKNRLLRQEYNINPKNLDSLLIVHKISKENIDEQRYMGFLESVSTGELQEILSVYYSKIMSEVYVVDRTKTRESCLELLSNLNFKNACNVFNVQVTDEEEFCDD